jgi:hypothetical protein
VTLWRCSLVFRDRDEHERTASLTTSAGTVPALVAFANGMAAALQPLSNAAIVRAVIATQWRYAAIVAPPQSDVARKALLLSRGEPITTGYRYGSLVVSSPAPQVWDANGDGLYKVSRTTALPALRNAIDGVLALGWLGVDNQPVPVEEWVYALLHE